MSQFNAEPRPFGPGNREPVDPSSAQDRQATPPYPPGEPGPAPEPIVWENGVVSDAQILSDDARIGVSVPSAFFVNQTETAKAREGLPLVQPGSFYLRRGCLDPRAEYDGKAFVQDSFPVPRPVYEALVSALTERLDRLPDGDEIRLVAHVYVSGALRKRDNGKDAEGFAPVGFALLARSVPAADVERLILSGVLDMAPHSVSGGRSRAFGVSAEIGAVLDSALVTAAPTAPYVNLFTGKAKRGRKPGSQKTDENRNPLSPIVTDAMDAVPLGILNLPATEAHVERLRAKVDEAQGTEAKTRAALRLRNDMLCLTWIKSRRLTETDAPGIYTYPHAWRSQSAGRIMPLESGGAQSMSRAGKAAMYEGVADVRNYDLRSSQPRILADEFRRAGIACDWLDSYLADEQAKTVHAARVGVAVDTWKAALIAAITGGGSGVPKRFQVKPVRRIVRGIEQTTLRPVCAAMRTLETEVGRERAEELWPVLHSELTPLLGAVRKWHRTLKGWTDETATTGRDGRGVTNAVGARLCVSDLSTRQLPRKVAAHVLQGREALYVHTLATLGPAYGFRVVCHEHDGLVTLGEVPQAAMDEAAKVAEMPYAEMVPKEFV